jgi:DNA-binding SARP family transcriptional activator
MRFGVLGPLAVEAHEAGAQEVGAGAGAGAGGRILDLGGRRQRSVLARLLVAGGQVVSVDRLLDDLWNGEPPPRAVGSLQAFVSNLRRLLEPDRPPRTPATLLVSTPPGYALRAGADDVDAVRFERLLAEGSRALAEGRPAAAVAMLDEALSLWRGDAYADFADEDWAAPEAARLGELRLVAREHRLAAALAEGDAAGAVPALEMLAADHPLREGIGRLLALALYRTGRQADALAVLRTVRTHLLDELGIDPSPALQQLENQVLVQAPELDWERPREAPPAPAPPSSVSVPNQREADSSPTPDPSGPVGRESPLARLTTEADLAAHGSAGLRVAVLSGEPGIGKTYLVEALARQLTGTGWALAWGRCPDAEGVPALWPWHQVLGTLVEAHPPAAEVAQPLANLLDRSTPTASTAAPPGDVAEARFRQHDAVARHLAASTTDQPLLLVLDDLQWADTSSLRLLMDLVALRRGGRVLLVATVRSGEGGPALQDALARLADAGALRIELAGLDQRAVERLATEADVGLRPDEVRRLVERTAGNPFFIRETLKLARSEGSGSLDVVAPTVQDALRRRLGRLPERSQALLAAAAVLGRDVDPDLLAEVSGTDEDTVLDALDGAVVSGVLVDRGTGRLRFAHDLLRETASAALPPLRRGRVHARAARALEQSGGDPAAVAFQALAAGPGELERAVRNAEAAARAAHRRFAFDDAVRWLRSAVEAAADGEPRRSVELRLALVRAELDAGEWVAARRTRAAALRASDETGDLLLAARALVALDAPSIWTLHEYAEIDLDIVGRVERVLAELPQEDSDLRCRLLGTLAAELYDGSADPRCDELSAAAVAMARRLGDPRLLSVALTSRYHAVHMPRYADELLIVGGELIALGREHTMPAVELLGHQVDAMFRLLRLEVRKADEAAAACEPLLRRLQLPPQVAVQRLWDADRLCLNGDLEDAARAYEQAFVIHRALGFFGTDGLAAVLSALLGALGGRWAQVQAQLPALDMIGPYFATTIRIWVAAATGRVDEARMLAAAAEPTPLQDWAEVTALAARGEAVLAAGDLDAVRRIRELLSPFSGLLAAAGNSFTMGPVDYYLGRLARALSEVDVAERHFDAAERACRREGLSWWAEQVAAVRSVAATR